MKAVVDRIVQYANRYQLTNVETGEVLGIFDFEEVTGTVQQVGTEIDKELFDSIANDLAARVKLSGGELAGTVVTFSDISGTAANVASGDTSATLWGKVKNWFSRLKALAFKNKVAAGDFEAGAIKNADVAADADIAQGKVNGLMTDYVASISVSGRTVTYKNKNGVNMGSITTQDTTYGLASQSSNGLMSSTDKTKLDGIESGAQKNTVLGVKGSSESAYRTGNVNITKANIGLGNVDNTSDEDKPVSTATQTALNGKANTSGSYPNLTVGNADKLGNKAASEYALMTIKTAAEWESENPVLKAGEFGYDSTFTKIKVGDGSTAWKALASLVNSRFTFGTAAWGDIAQISKNGEAKKHFNVGDEKTIELSTGEVITVVILGFDHDDLTSGGKAGITIGMKNLLTTTYRMNATGTNAGDWDESEMRTSTMATLLSQLPSDLQGVIKQVNKKATAGSQSENITTSADKLWLLAMSEIFSATSIEKSSSSTIANYADAYNAEGTQYKYYENLIGDNNGGTTANSLLIKKLSNGSGSASYWWLRSLLVNSNSGFRCITSAGGVNSSYANYTFGVSFCFCV